jgi:hypothetical protein
LIAAVLPELAELDGVDGLVVVHRPLVQRKRPERQREASEQDEDSRSSMEDSGG